MNDDRIREVAEVAELAHLPEDDPRRIAAMRSPRTRALLALYQDFLTQPPAGPLGGADVADADARLAAALDRELGVTVDAAAPAEPARAPRPAPRRGLFDGLFAPALRPAFALAAVVLVAGAVWMGVQSRRESPAEPVMRGEADGPFRAEIRTQGDGRATLQWTTVAGAERYELRFYAQDLSELARVAQGAATRADLVAGQLPAGLPAGQVVLWQAVALKGGDVLAESPTSTVRLP